MKISLFKYIILAIFFTVSINRASSQELQLGLYAEPLVSWFGSDTKASVNDGARAGFAFGLTFDTYFAGNYAFSTGISIINASGRLSYSDTLLIRFKNSEDELPAGDKIIYRIQYLAVPTGIKMRTNQIGYLTFYANVGLNPKVVIGGKADIPSLNIESENITEELKVFNLGYYISAGTEYSLGGKTSIITGLVYEDNFMDITKDYQEQPSDKIRHHMIRIRIGINF